MLLNYKNMSKYIYERIEKKDIWNLWSALSTARWIVEMKFGHLVTFDGGDRIFSSIYKNLENIDQHEIDQEFSLDIRECMDIAIDFYEEFDEHLDNVEDKWYKCYNKEDK